MNPAENYILNQTEPYRSMLLHVQSIIQHAIPEVAMKYKWNIPCFYVEKSPICYLNVSKKKQFLDVAFWNSALLTQHLDKMISEKRKVVKSLRYTSLEEIDDMVLIAVLKDAYSVRNGKFYTK